MSEPLSSREMPNEQAEPPSNSTTRRFSMIRAMMIAPFAMMAVSGAVEANHTSTVVFTERVIMAGPILKSTDVAHNISNCINALAANRPELFRGLENVYSTVDSRGDYSGKWGRGNESIIVEIKAGSEYIEVREHLQGETTKDGKAAEFGATSDFKDTRPRFYTSFGNPSDADKNGAAALNTDLRNAAGDYLPRPSPFFGGLAGEIALEASAVGMVAGIRTLRPRISISIAGSSDAGTDKDGSAETDTDADDNTV